MHSPSIKLLPSKGDLLRWEADIAKTGRKAKKKSVSSEPTEESRCQQKQMYAPPEPKKECLMQSESR